MWIVAIDRGFYPDVESFDNEEEALANYNFIGMRIHFGRMDIFVQQ